MANDKEYVRKWQVNLEGEEIDQLRTLTGQVSLVTSCMAYTGKDGVDLTAEATSSLILILDGLRNKVTEVLNRAELVDA